MSETDRSFLESRANGVFDFDKKIRAAVLLSSDGKAIMTIERPGLVSLEPESESDTVYVKASIAMSMGDPMNRYFGRVRTVILIRERVTIVVFNLSGRILLISADPGFGLEKVDRLGQLVDQLNLS